jgi:hypothetical protein
MMTMSRAMQMSLSRSLIIGVLAFALALLSGCSALRFGYTQAPELVYWWLDGYVDVDETQSPQVRDAVRDWFRWHRQSQLPDYAQWLARLSPQLSERITPAQVCRLQDEVAARMGTAFDRAVPAMAEFARTLSPEQIAHLQRKHAKNNADYRRNYLQEGADERRAGALKRIVERAETLYGPLDDAQRERIGQLLDASPFDPQAWFAERRLRQQEVVQLVRRVQGEGTSPAEAQAAIRQAYANTFRSPREPYRQYQQRLAQYNCSFAAEVHNLTTPEQRRRAIAKLKGWVGKSFRPASNIAPSSESIDDVKPSLVTRTSYSGWADLRSRISIATSRS